MLCLGRRFGLDLFSSGIDDKGVFSKNSFAILICIITIVSIGRFFFLEKSPPGFYVDEAIGATNIICMRQTGHDGYGVPMPLFAEAARNAGGYTTPAFLYSGILWTALFGDSIFSFRAFMAFVTTLTIVGLFFLVRQQMGKDVALLSVFAASLSPWAWQFSRISWDPPFMPLFFVWGMYFFLKSNRIRDSVLAGILFSLAMYSYPPGRVMVPLLFVGVWFFKYFQKKFDFKFILIFLGIFILTSVPLFVFLLKPESLMRFGAVGITNPEYLRHFGEPGIFLILKILVKNILLHVHPQFLLISGDTNLRHSTQYAGELGWVDLFGMLALIITFFKYRSIGKKNDQNFLGLCLYGFFCGILPAALTWESIPHALRAIGAWPFVACMVGIGLAELCRRNGKSIYSIVFVAILFIIVFGYKYFVMYPNSSHAWFDSEVKEWAQEATVTGDWNLFDQKTTGYLELGRNYYHLAYGKKFCGQLPHVAQ